MEELTRLLNRVRDSYYDFVVTVLAYSKYNEGRLIKVKKFIANTSEASTSDVLRFISEQPDFYKDDVAVGKMNG